MKTSYGFGHWDMLTLWLTSLTSIPQKQTYIAHKQCFHLSEWGKLHVFPMLKGLFDLSCFLSIAPSTHSSFFASQRSTFHYRRMIHCFWLHLCSGNKLSHQQRSRATHHPLWDRRQSHCTLSSTDHKINTTLSLVIRLHFTTKCCRGLGVCFWCLISLPLQNQT